MDEIASAFSLSEHHGVLVCGLTTISMEEF